MNNYFDIRATKIAAEFSGATVWKGPMRGRSTVKHLLFSKTIRMFIRCNLDQTAHQVRARSILLMGFKFSFFFFLRQKKWYRSVVVKTGSLKGRLFCQ